MDNIKDAIRFLQAYIPQEREGISSDERKLGIRKKDLETLTKNLEALLKTEALETKDDNGSINVE